MTTRPSRFCPGQAQGRPIEGGARGGKALQTGWDLWQPISSQRLAKTTLPGTRRSRVTILCQRTSTSWGLVIMFAIIAAPQYQHCPCPGSRSKCWWCWSQCCGWPEWWENLGGCERGSGGEAGLEKGRMNTITGHTKAIYSANQAILQVANNIDWENIFCNGLVGYLQYGKYMAARKASLNSLRRGTSSHSGALLLMWCFKV